jgi:hypothetical protein
MFPKEVQESVRRWAAELNADPDMVATEYEKIFRSRHLEKLDEPTRHQEALKELKFRLMDRLQLRKFRKGKHEPVE